ncbi:Zinc finger mym-type protein 1 [Plakobranchus ocellatus]|uniref:Zinc finger mym-type protein 1 n=1 Tax=Plakobranchus ocellatus TaxID=259542 RepID=A0AAV4AK40_9GAST|nr:Zinc finger mym-type protein 1 [Plakobranchus ocellatus]
MLEVISKPREPKISDDVKSAKLQLAAAMACHCSISAIDHLGEIIVKYGQGSTIGNIKIHRTKCANLIKNVLSPSLKEVVISNFKNKKYCIIVDESTDVSTYKHLCILVRFFSDQLNAVSTLFLALVYVHETTAENIFNMIEEEIKKCNQTLENCLGFVSDGASTMIGCNNSVWRRIKAASPMCIQVKCVCHSLALCIQNAAGKLPSNIAFLLCEIPAWFSHSDLRRQNFKSVFYTINPDEDTMPGKTTPLPFEKLSSTRCLVRGKVMNNILANWYELKAYFELSDDSKRYETRYKARLIKEMMQDHKNYLYFQFAVPIVKEFETVNSLFQHTNFDPTILDTELYTHYESLHGRLYHPDGTPKVLDDVDFGCKFTQEVQRYVSQHSEIEQILRDVEDLKRRYFHS